MSAEVYGLQYNKDYRGEVAWLAALAHRHGLRGSPSWLDMACGTGDHLRHAGAYFGEAAGVDLSPHMLAVARERLPDSISLYEGDMATVRLGRKFDVVTCLFSAVSYLATEAGVRRAVANMVRHTLPGGLVMVQPWLHPQEFYTDNMLHPTEAKADGGELVRRVVLHGPPAGEEGTVHMQMGFLYSRPDPEDGRLQIDAFTEDHDLALLHEDTYRQAMVDAGMQVLEVEPPPSELPDVRPLFIGRVAV